MKYYSILPLTALFAITVIQSLVYFGIIPHGMFLLEQAKTYFGEAFYLLIFLTILVEAIVYMGFYFPGQFFAVVMVILAKPDTSDIAALTGCMVAAATLGSWFNFQFGKRFRSTPDAARPVTIKALLLAMIHINSLAFFMVNQGARGGSISIVWLSGLLNLPYYLLLIVGTSLLSEQVMAMAENNLLLFSLICVWLIVAAVLDLRNHRAAAVSPGNAT